MTAAQGYDKRDTMYNVFGNMECHIYVCVCVLSFLFVLDTRNSFLLCGIVSLFCITNKDSIFLMWVKIDHMTDCHVDAFFVFVYSYTYYCCTSCK